MKKQQGALQDEVKKTLIQKLRHPYSLLRSLMKKQKGFTLIELMVVMAIIAILATAGLSAYTGYLQKARDSARLSIAHQVETAITNLMGGNGGIPPTDVALIAELERLNMASAVDVLTNPEAPRYLSTVSDVLKNILTPSLYAAIKEPSGGRPICIGYDNSGNIIKGQSCAFRYLVYSDNTYVVGYGVESKSNIKENFYKVSTNPGDPNAAYFMQVTGTAPFVGTPSPGESGGDDPSDGVAAYVSSRATPAEPNYGDIGLSFSAPLSDTSLETTDAGGGNNTGGGGNSGGCYNSGFDEYGNYLTYSCRWDLTPNPPSTSGPSET